MTDQSIEQENKNIFEETKVEDQKTNPDQDDKTSTQNKAPDLEAIFNEKLSSIVDDKGEQKYKDVFTALEALNHSQQYIRTLEEENKTFRDTKMERDTLQQAFQNISAKNNQPETTKSEGVDAEQLKQMISATLMETKSEELRQTNKKSVSEALVKKYGSSEKAKEAYEKKAEELGIDPKMLADLAASSPKAALAFFGSADSSYSKTTGSINPSALKPNGDKQVDYSARYFNSSEGFANKWREAGEGLNF